MFFALWIDMRLVVFFNGFNLWLLRGYYYKHATNTNHTITERYARYKKT
ncbi:hypothetical protein L7D53_02095 [Helicobacter pylori]|nr:hypothetical protein [Helicobacter pylori]